MEVLNLPVFKSPTFHAFAQALAIGIQDAQIPRNELLERVSFIILTKKAIPSVKQSLDSIQQFLIQADSARGNISMMVGEQTSKMNSYEKKIGLYSTCKSIATFLVV